MPVHCLKKSKGWFVYLLSTAKNRMPLSHLQLMLEFFKVRKPEFFALSYYTVVLHSEKYKIKDICNSKTYAKDFSKFGILMLFYVH
jgi:hypothetical protein